MDKVSKGVDGRAAAEKHEAVDPELPAKGVLDHLAQVQFIGLGVAAIALDSVKNGLEIRLGEGRLFARGEELIGERQGEEVPDEGETYCNGALNAIKRVLDQLT